jgi:hypothetical protein
VLNIPQYVGPGTSLGLFAGLISIPTRSGTGFTTAFNTLAGFSQTDNAVGFTVTDSAGAGGDHIEGIVQAYPGVPFTITWLQALPFSFANNNWCGLVVMNTTTGKLMGFEMHAGTLQVIAYTTPILFSSTPTTHAYPLTSGPIWFNYQDDGTNIFFSASSDGVTWTQIYTVTRAASFLGSTGFNFFGFATNAFTTPVASLTVMSYVMTTP